jgi:pyridoxine 5-phosphate synthase
VRRITLALDSLSSLREATAAADVDLAAAATLAELAGVDAIRLGVNEDLKPVREEDVREARRAARRLELRMPPVMGLVKVALEGRPDRVVLASEGRDGSAPSGPLDLRGSNASIEPVVRALAEAGIPVAAVIGPEAEAVKRIHAESIPGGEFYTGAIVDLPSAERREEIERLSAAVRLASKLGMVVGLGGGLSYRNLPEILTACPAAEWVSVGRSALARSLLVGLDRALRDLRALAS